MKLKEFWKNIKIKKEKVRKVIDFEQNEHLLEESVEKKELTESEKRLNQILKNLKIDAFDVKIIRILDEMYLPGVYKIYLSSNDYGILLGSEREFLERKLREIILIQARDLANNSKLTTEKIEVIIAEDGTLEEGNIQVIPSDTSSNTIEFRKDNSGTWIDERIDFNPLYYLEIWQDEKKIEEFPILKRVITIGRETEDRSANIRLKTDNKNISSLHAAVEFKSKDNILISAMHKNITKVGETVISSNKPEIPKEIKLGEDEEIQIYSFNLKLRVEK